jgi:hypothetical protein
MIISFLFITLIFLKKIDFYIWLIKNLFFLTNSTKGYSHPKSYTYVISYSPIPKIDCQYLCQNYNKLLGNNTNKEQLYEYFIDNFIFKF